MSLFRHVVAGTCALIVTVLSTNLWEHGARADDLPDLVGSWVATEGQLHFWHGTPMEVAKDGHVMRIDIDEQIGALLSAVMVYTNPSGVHGHDGDDLTETATEKMVGVIDWDGKTILFVDTPDIGFHRIVLIDDDTMEMTMLESGEFALAGRMILKRSTETSD